MQNRYDSSSHTEPAPMRDSLTPRPESDYPSESPSPFPNNEGSHPVRPALPPSRDVRVAARGSLTPQDKMAGKNKTPPSWLWLLAQFTASLITQLADIVAPLLLVVGCAWALVPVLSRLVTDALAQADPQTKDLALQVIAQLPSHIKMAGISWNAFGIIALALFLMIASAFSVTWQAYLNKRSL